MQMKHLLLLASLLTFMGAGAQQATFRNPVIAGDMADPTVIRVGNTYYATGTSSEWAPYYPLFRSKDLVNWQQIGHLFEQQPAWTRSSFWAPELFHRNGKTYAYYTARRKTDGTSYIGVATADKPEGPYTDHGPIVEYGTEAIDAFVLEDAGELYISWKAYGLDPRPIELLACKISDDGLRMAGEPFTLLRDDKRQGMEGQHWLKIGDYYYIVYSINGCCGPGSDYAVAVARSKNLRGPTSVTPGTRSCTAAAMSSPSGTAPSRRRPTGGCSTSATPIWPVRISFWDASRCCRRSSWAMTCGFISRAGRRHP